jgi:predicted  nucleic acid-binding Zn-ribbon protein
LQAKDQLLRLLRMQELSLEIRESRQVIEGAPSRLEEIEGRFRERNSEYVAVKDQYDELEQDRTTRTQQLQELEEQRDKFMADLMQVKNQREYAAMLKEIDAVKAEISGHEEAILKDMDGVEKLTEELKTHEEHIAREREVVKSEIAEVEANADAARKRLEELTAERHGIEGELPKGVVATVRRLESSRQGIFLSKADNGTCLSCFVRVRPQMFQEIKMASAVHACGNCRRFLYFAPTLEPAHDESQPAPPAADASDVAPINGGAV